MPAEVTLATPAQVAPLRDLYRAYMNCQIIHDSWLERGWTDPYILRLDGRLAGYGLVGGVRGADKNTIIEFFLVPTARPAALGLLQSLAAAARAEFIEAQSNDPLLSILIHDVARDIQSDTVLFHDARTTNLAVPGATFRAVPDAERPGIFPHHHEPVGQWAIESEGRIVATGGLLFHYNPPWGDIHMEVAEPFRRRGLGSLLVQELKRTCYEMGRIPAARCSADNLASRATLQKAGLVPCGRLLTGTLRL
jgi:GNAT superfamily N-acetyltransferase